MPANKIQITGLDQLGQEEPKKGRVQIEGLDQLSFLAAPTAQPSPPISEVTASLKTQAAPESGTTFPVGESSFDVNPDPAKLARRKGNRPYNPQESIDAIRRAAAELSSGRAVDADGIPFVPTAVEQESLRLKRAADELERMINPAQARTIGEFFESSSNRLGKSLHDFVLERWGAVDRSLAGLVHTGRNIAKAVADVTGTNETFLYERIDSVLSGQEVALNWMDPASDLPSQILDAIAGAAIEVPKFAILSRVPGVLPIYGALERYDEGPLGMAKGAAAMTVLNAMFKGTAAMPYSSKALIYPATFMGLDAAEGRTQDEIVLSGATGFILAAMAGKGDPNASLSNQIRRELKQSPLVQKVMQKRAGEIQAGEKLDVIAREVADRYTEVELKRVHDTIQASETGKTETAGYPKGFLKERARVTPSQEGTLEIAAITKGDPVIVKLAEGGQIRGVVETIKGEPHTASFAYEVKLPDSRIVEKPARDVEAAPELIQARQRLERESKEVLSSEPKISDLISKSLDGKVDVPVDAPLEAKLDAYLKQFDPGGFLTPEGRAKLVSNFMKAAEVAQKRADVEAAAVAKVTQADVNIAHDKVTSVHRKMETDIEASHAPVLTRLLEWATKKWWDSSGNLKRAFRTQDTSAGQAFSKEIEMRHDLLNGAFALAEEGVYYFRQNVLKGMTSKQDLTDLGAHIHGRRVIAIDQYRTGKETVKHPGNLTGHDYKLAIIRNRQTWGEERYRAIDETADRYFTWQREQVRQLRDAGVISETEFKNLAKREYSPRVFINKIDPQLSYKLGGELINVSSSGIKPLERGSYSSLITDPELLAQQIIVRVSNRILRNRANKALYKFAQAYPDGPLVQLPKKVKHDEKGRVKDVYPPKDHVRVDTMIDGKQQPMFLSGTIAEEWIRSNPSMTRATANMLRITSGSFIVRPLATGINPIFAISNFPIDSALIWLRTNEYSPILPVAMVRHLVDVAAVSRDAWRREGRYLDYIREGGGMSFLTHQGTTVFGTGFTRDPLIAQMNPRLSKIKDTLGHLNEWSELVNRLALRDAALRNGKSPDEATYIARNYLDFSQGGTYSKALDNLIPYFNAGTQGTRSIFRGAIDDPIGFSAKVAQFMAIEAALELANWSVNPEVMDQIPYDMKVQNWIITTPFNFVDSQGNKRWLYIPIRKEHALTAMVAPVTTTMERVYGDRVPTDATSKVLSGAFPGPWKGGIGIPTIDAFYTYAANKNFWSDRKVWTGAQVPPEEEIYRFGSGRKPTNPVAIVAAQSMGISPARLEAAGDKLVPTNPYTALVGYGLKQMFEGTTPYDMSRTTEETILQMPGMSRIVAMTHPFSREADLAETISQQTTGELSSDTATIDEMYALHRSGQLEGGMNSIRARVRNIPPERQDAMNKHLEAKIDVDRVFDRMSPDYDIPSRTWWSLLSSKPAEVRADVYYEEWRRRGPEERRVMERTAQRLQGFYTERFVLRLKRSQKQRGEDQY